MHIKQVVTLGIVGSIVLSLAAGGKGSLEKIQSDLNASSVYEASKEGNRSTTNNARQESKIVWDMVQQEGVISVVGLSPDVNKLTWVSVPLDVGQVATIGGKNEIPFATGALLGDYTGKIARVGYNGRIENPIVGSQTPLRLPVVPKEYQQEYQEKLQALRQMKNIPQAVVSTPGELVKRRIAMQQQQLLEPVQTLPPVERVATQPINVPQAPQQEQQPPTNTVQQMQTQTYPTFGQEKAQQLPKVKLD